MLLSSSAEPEREEINVAGDHYASTLIHCDKLSHNRQVDYITYTKTTLLVYLRLT